MNVSDPNEGRDLVGDVLKVWESPRHLRCRDLSFFLRDIAALDESRQVCRRSAEGLNDDICHAPSALDLLCAPACGKKVLFFKSVCSQFIRKLSADQGRIALFIYDGIHSTDCMRLFLNTSTSSSLLHETPPSIALHVDVYFESMASPLRVRGRPCSLSVKSWMTFGLAYAALYVLLTVTDRVSLRQAAVAKSGCKKPFGPLVKRFSTEG